MSPYALSFPSCRPTKRRVAAWFKKNRGTPTKITALTGAANQQKTPKDFLLSFSKHLFPLKMELRLKQSKEELGRRRT